jgi:hypothetical protein
MRKTLLIIMFYGLAIAAMVVDPLRNHHRINLATAILIQILILAAVVTMIARQLTDFHQRMRLSHAPHRDIEQVDGKHVKRLQALAGSSGLSQLQAQIFALSILEPAELRQRVVERYTPGQRTLEQDVTIEVQIPRRLLPLQLKNSTESDQAENKIINQDSEIIIPILIPPKGQLHDNLDVFDADGAQLSPLSYREYLQNVAGTLRALFCTIELANPRKRIDKSTLRLLERRSLQAILLRVGNDLQIKGMPSRSVAERDSEAVATEILAEGNASPVAQLAAALVKKLSQNYAITVRLPVQQSGRFFIRYTRTIIPELELPIDHTTKFAKLAKLKSQLRVLLGARPIDMTISLDNAWTCQSYHARITVSEGLYLVHQGLEAPEGYFAQIANGAPSPLHYRLRRRLGQPYAHLYGRFFPVPSKGAKRPKLKLKFSEVPPGSSFRAALTSLACLALIWVVGVIVSHAVNNPVDARQSSAALTGFLSSLGTDVPAFLLAFPAVAAGLVGIDNPTPRIFEGTLAARLSLALTAVLSVSASGLFLLDRADFHFITRRLPWHLTLFGVSNLSWALLIAVSLLNTAYAVHRWCSCSLEFKYLAGRNPADEDDDQMVQD